MLNTDMQLDQPFVPSPTAETVRSGALAALWLLLEAPDLLLAHRRELMSVAVWKYTEAPSHRPYAKYRLPYRTRAAMDVSVPAAVQHEHVWPRKWLIDRMLVRHVEGWTKAELADLMVAHGVACTVTRQEHLELNAHAAQEGWARYAAAGIEVWDCLHDRPLVTSSDRARTGEEVSSRERRPAEVPLDERVAAVLDANTHRKAALVRRFAARAARAGVDVVPQDHRGDARDTYLRVHAALDEPTPAVLYINLNGALDFRLGPDQVPDLMVLPGVVPRQDRRYRVRCVLTDEDSIDSGLQLLDVVLGDARAA